MANASKVEQLTELLERAVTQLKTPAGEPLVTPLAVQLRLALRTLVLHLVSRNLTRKGDDFVPSGQRWAKTAPEVGVLIRWKTGSC